MDTQFDFQLELNTRQAREMCSVMNKEELTELVVAMYRSDFLKNQWMKTFFLGDANAFALIIKIVSVASLSTFSGFSGII